MKRTFRRINAENGISQFTPLQLYVAGGVAGVANSIVSGPVEHIRYAPEPWRLQRPKRDHPARVAGIRRLLSRVRTARAEDDHGEREEGE